MEIAPCLLLLVQCVLAAADVEQNGQAFGAIGKSLDIEVLDGFIEKEEFFDRFVRESKPVKFKGAYLDSAACKQWTDEYFLSDDLPNENVFVETQKKENRSQETLFMDFKEFVRTYNNTDLYMVEDMPDFLADHVPIPKPLICREIYQNYFTNVIMWFSSGDTKSVVHTDSYENIFCVVRGRKHFTLVDNKFQAKLQTGFIEAEGYWDLDVDNVDLKAFPGWDQVEYYHVDLDAGDCLFIPDFWIHQVNSIGSNIGISFWWKPAAEKLDLSKCRLPKNPGPATIANVLLAKQDLEYHDVKMMFLRMAKKGPITPFDIEAIVADETKLHLFDDGDGYMHHVHNLFNLFDKNHDDQITYTELHEAPHKAWKAMEREVGELLDTEMRIKEEADFGLYGDPHDDFDEDYYEDMKQRIRNDEL